MGGSRIAAIWAYTPGMPCRRIVLVVVLVLLLLSPPLALAVARLAPVNIWWAGGSDQLPLEVGIYLDAWFYH